MEKPSMPTTIIAGGVAGASETSVTYPAEFIKTRRQLPQNKTLKSASSFSLIRSTLQSSGFSGLYSGCKALAIANTGKSGIRFWSFEAAKDVFKPFFSHGSSWVNVFAGLSAGIAESVFVVTPGEAIKTKIIHDAAMSTREGGGRFANSSLTATITRLVKNDGIFSLWRGLSPVICKQGTNSAVRFATFGLFQEWARKIWPGQQQQGPGSVLLIGGLSGVVTTYASMPFDNVKTRMQSLGSKQKGILDCALTMLRAEGVLVFWRATTPRLVRLTLSSAITFTVFDQVVQLVAAINLKGENRAPVLI